MGKQLMLPIRLETQFSSTQPTKLNPTISLFIYDPNPFIEFISFPKALMGKVDTEGAQPALKIEA